jgi:hypothetical protein
MFARRYNCFVLEVDLIQHVISCNRVTPWCHIYASSADPYIWHKCVTLLKLVSWLTSTTTVKLFIKNKSCNTMSNNINISITCTQLIQTISCILLSPMFILCYCCGVICEQRMIPVHEWSWHVKPVSVQWHLSKLEGQLKLNYNCGRYLYAIRWFEIIVIWNIVKIGMAVDELFAYLNHNFLQWHLRGMASKDCMNAIGIGMLMFQVKVLINEGGQFFNLMSF